MSGDYFDRLDTELADLVRRAAHLDERRARSRGLGLLARRTVLAVTLALALAASLIGEFPASASGHPPLLPVAAVGS